MPERNYLADPLYPHLCDETQESPENHRGYTGGIPVVEIRAVLRICEERVGIRGHPRESTAGCAVLSFLREIRRDRTSGSGSERDQFF